MKQRSEHVIQPWDYFNYNWKLLLPTESALKLTRDFERMCQECMVEWQRVGAKFANSFIPNLEVKEEKDQFVVITDLEELKDDNVEISLKSGVLTIEANQDKREGNKKDQSSASVEVKSFPRIFFLPPNVDEENIEASLKDGKLKITVPKMTEVKGIARDIKINASNSKSESHTRKAS
ncbi:MAG: Hsp20 family protein [Alphaproteobacteria bacterium]|nr:Hsp20 family protein [Alphaproteobacteria bacterium]